MLKIEKGIPLVKRGPPVPRKYPTPLLEVGESYLVPVEDGDTIVLLRARMNVYVHGARKLFPDRSFAVRTVTGGVRVWRTR
jgi:hypothetical protein